MQLPKNTSEDLRNVCRTVLHDDGGNSGTPDKRNGRFVFRGEAQLDHVEDGDTWHGKHRCSPDYVTARRPREGSKFPAGQWYRLTGIDTHETGGENADQAAKETKFVEEFVATGRQQSDDDWPFIVEFGDKQGEIAGTYGRLLVDLRRKSDGRSLAQALIDEFGDAVKYQGSVVDQVAEFAAEDLPS